MSAGARATLVLAVSLLVTVAGAVDAVRGGGWDLAVVFGVVVALQVVALVVLHAGAPSAPLRSDLAAWVRRHAAATGEPAQRILDRSVAAHRAGLGDPQADDPRADDAQAADRADR